MNLKLLTGAIVSSAFLLPGSASGQTADFNIVPQPLQVDVTNDAPFILNGKTSIVVASKSNDMKRNATLLASYIEQTTGVRPVIGKSGKNATSIVLAIDKSVDNAEGYKLDIDAKSVRIAGATAAGVFYGIQTLRKALPVVSGKASQVTIPCAHIVDAPRFSYRGTHLDVSRHFVSTDEIRQFIDMLALHNINRFHWHLTDDQGWRIEINAYPQLTKVGSMRRRTIIGKDPNGEYDENTPFDETPYGGYYTQDQVREIVEYAAQRHITVVPEIEFPGHAVAALASCPWLSCTGEQYRVRETWDIDDRVYCIGKESTFRFMENVLSEVIDLFPSPYIHIGGDECPDKMWQKCPSCAKRMKAEGLETYRQLQGYGVKRLENFLSEHGRSIIGWDEILEAGVESSAIVMSWRGAQSGIKAAQSGNHVIMSPTDYSYFDYYQFDSTVVQPLAWGGYIPLEKVYSFDPYTGLDPEQRKLVLGIQANLWSEYIPSLSQLEYMMLPRLAALSETAWSPSKKNINRFLTDCKRFERLYGSLGYNYAKSAENED